MPKKEINQLQASRSTLRRRFASFATAISAVISRNAYSDFGTQDGSLRISASLLVFPLAVATTGDKYREKMTLSIDHLAR